ncbi:MAG: 4Fe-4S dicluster domain-containing protein [Candidatus Hodarchaeales archaeon]|jgi:heterodisulfide reductase subunit C
MISSIQRGLDTIFSLIRPCYQCGTCAGGCPVFRNNPEMNPRLIAEKLLLGLTEDVFQTQYAWNCSFCITCSERCPQGVDLAHILVDLKNLSVREGIVPPAILNEMKMLNQNGMTLETSKMIIKRRKKMNLPELLHPNVLDIQKILKKTGIYDLLNSNP